MTVTLPADDLQVHSITLPVMLPFYAGPLYAIHHLYAASTGPARYQCVASTTSIHLQQFENSRDQCAVANAGTMAHDVCINPSVFYTCGMRHCFCCVQRESKC